MTMVSCEKLSCRFHAQSTASELTSLRQRCNHCDKGIGDGKNKLLSGYLFFSHRMRRSQNRFLEPKAVSFHP